MMKHQKFAVDYIFTSYPDGLEFDDLLEDFQSETNPDSYVVWEPFEQYDSDLIAKRVRELADSVYQTFSGGQP